MKKMLSLSFLLLFGVTLQAQVASTECLAEASSVYAHIDHQQLLKQESPTLLKYRHSYIMRADPKREKVEIDEWRMYARNFMHHDAREFEECTDASEAFNYRKFQYIVYRTKSTLSKAGLIPDMEVGLFAHCTVRKCKFIPAPGEDSTSHKMAFLTVDDEGQKNYKVKDLEMIWDPITGVPVSVTVNFTDRARTVWAKYAFESIGPVEASATRAADVFLEAGKLKGAYEGADLKDYR